MTRATTYNIRIKGRNLLLTQPGADHMLNQITTSIFNTFQALCAYKLQNSNGKPQAVPTNTSSSEAIIHIRFIIKVQFASNLNYIEVRNKLMTPWNDEMPQALEKES